MFRATDMRQKEVINICDGSRLGFVYDVEMDLAKGSVEAIIVPGNGKFLGIFGRDNDYIIPWNNIKKIGEDIILVDLDNRTISRMIEK